MNNSLRQTAALVAYFLLTFAGMRAFEWLHASNPLWHWLAFAALSVLTMVGLQLRDGKRLGVMTALLWGWILATFWTHQTEVQLLQHYLGFGSIALWTSVFWMILVPVLLAFLPMAQYCVRFWRNEPQQERFSQIAGIFLLQLVLWLLLVVAITQLPAILAFSWQVNTLLLALGFLLFLMICSVHSPRLALTVLGIGFAMMAGSLGQLLHINQSGVGSVALWISALVVLIALAFYLGWVIRGRPEQPSEPIDVKPEALPELSAAEQAENARLMAEYQRRNQLTLAERLAEDLAAEEAEILLKADLIRQQTPEDRAAKLRAAIAAAEARDAADKWTRE